MAAPPELDEGPGLQCSWKAFKTSVGFHFLWGNIVRGIVNEKNLVFEKKKLKLIPAVLGHMHIKDYVPLKATGFTSR